MAFHAGQDRVRDPGRKRRARPAVWIDPTAIEAIGRPGRDHGAGVRRRDGSGICQAHEDMTGGRDFAAVWIIDDAFVLDEATNEVLPGLDRGPDQAKGRFPFRRPSCRP